MAEATLPSTMRVWKYASAEGGLEKNLTLHTSEPLPKPGPNQHLIKVLAVGLNPVDFKPAEAPFVGRFAVKKPATPGFDVAGRIVTPADGSSLEPGQLVFGAASTNPLAGGALAEYIASPAETLCPAPTGVSPLVLAGAPIAAVTAHGSLIPYIHTGSRVFLNGGSGGVGTYGIQIAKAVGAHVTVSCSTNNMELCRSLGADEVLDYTKRPLLEQLHDVATQSRPFDHVVDNVFSDPALYYQAHSYTSAGANFVEVASGPTLKFMRFALGALLWPGLIGGGRRKFVIAYADIKSEHLEQIGRWISDGTIKPVTDQVFPMEDVVEAFKRLKTGRARGKVIVSVSKVED
jgi:NADPH:quinone reductase-like Zn-dependent oxidoreductase